MLDHRNVVKTYDALGVDVRDIGSNAGATLDVVQRELGDPRVELEEEGQRLADTATSAEDDHLGSLQGTRERMSVRLPLIEASREAICSRWPQ